MGLKMDARAFETVRESFLKWSQQMGIGLHPPLGAAGNAPLGTPNCHGRRAGGCKRALTLPPAARGPCFVALWGIGAGD